MLKVSWPSQDFGLAKGTQFEVPFELSVWGVEQGVSKLFIPRATYRKKFEGLGHSRRHMSGRGDILRDSWQIQGLCGRTMDVVFGSRIRGRGGGSSVADSVSCGLIVVLVADPVSRWHWVRAVDQDRGSWWVLVGGGGR
ncbi:unnamed protein product [Pleuronectes platessa]|uniref:Uncharacterized protein n=1 Tax=Pleuronectes platessa TaxID=8262 RepID=A0A9N7UR32_PLEPL|nr:unnamed protein product [Pleuronectes platessa]